MKNHAWIIATIIGSLTILVSIIIAIENSRSNEMRAMRLEMQENRKFNIAYTDKMVELLLEKRK